MDTIGARLRQERERLGETQDSFAVLAGVGKRALIHYEKDERVPDANFLAALSVAGVDVLYILTGQRQAQTGVTLTPRQAALLDNYEHTSEEGKKIIEGAAFAAAQPAAPVKGSAKRAA